MLMSKIITYQIFIIVCLQMNVLAYYPNYEEPIVISEKCYSELERYGYTQNDTNFYAIGKGQDIISAQVEAYIKIASNFLYGYKFKNKFIDKYKRNDINIAYMPLLEQYPKLQKYAELFNVEFKELKYKGEYRYLAIVNKNELYLTLKRKILENENNIDTYNEYLLYEDDYLKKFVYLEMSYILAKKNYFYNKNISAINRTPLELKYNPEELIYKVKEANDKLNFVVINNINLNVNKDIERIIYDEVNKYGLNIAVNTNASYIFRLDINIDERTDLSNTKNYKFSFNLTLLNKDKIIHIFNFNQNYIYISTSDFELAKKVAIDNIKNTLKIELPKQLEFFFNNKI